MPSSDRSAPAVTGRRSRRLPDALALVGVVVAALAVVAPALRPGITLGPFDLLSRIGLTARPGVRVHSAFPADQILYFLPMTKLAWQQVHAGHLPLWNPNNVLGTPLAFNWQSGVFSIPTLVAYLVPLRYAYVTIVVVKLVVAGSGAYVLCRVLRLRPLPSLFGALAFELSGPMVNYAGWAMTSVTAWSGWILALGVLVVRGRNRARHGALLAVVTAFAIYGGHPESVLVVAVSSVVFLGVLLWRHEPRSWAEAARSLRALGLAAMGGVALAAPLVLPGAQVGSLSSRASAIGAPVYGISHLQNLVAALHGTDFRTPPPYLGAITLALAVVALRRSWRQPAILALGATALMALLLTFQNPLYTVFDGFPKIRAISWDREAMLLALAVAVLGAAGLDQLLRAERRAALRTAAVALVVIGIAVAGTALAVGTGTLHAGAGRTAALAWAAAETVGGLVLVGVLGWVARARRAPGATSWLPAAAGAGLVALQGAALVFTGVGSWSIASAFFPTTPAVAALQHAVGDGLVGRGSCQPLPFTKASGAETGIRPNANIAYGVREFAAYEPILPHAYFESWYELSGERTPKYLQRVGVFCPVIRTAAEARVYGVQYVLTHTGAAGPTGAVHIGTIAGEELFAVPGSAEATLVPAGSGTPVPTDADGTPVAVHHPDDASWRMAVTSPEPALLRLRLTALPGWRATVDGHEVGLRHWAGGALLEAPVGAGHHDVRLRYWPPLFTAGLWLALAALVSVAATLALAGRRGRSRAGSPAP